MNYLYWNCRECYVNYKKGIYNLAELLFYICHSLKSYQLYFKEVKALMRIIKDALTEACWRDDLYIYNEWSRHSRFSFLSNYDKSQKWRIAERTSIDDSPLIVPYQPLDVINCIIRHWDSIYNHPYTYNMVTHLIEASDGLTTPSRLDERVKSFICIISNLNDEEQETEKALDEANIIMQYAYSLMGLGASKGRVQSPDEGL